MAEAATVARPYAKAVFMAARDSRTLAAWSEALRLGSAFIGDSKVSDLLSDPGLGNDRLVALFAGLGGEIDAHWQNLVRLLAQNKRLSVVPEIASQYRELREEYESRLEVEVTSAVALTDAHRTKLAAALKQRFKRDVRMSTRVDPSLLGGAVIRAGDLVIDGSIHGRLKRLESDLGG